MTTSTDAIAAERARLRRAERARVERTLLHGIAVAAEAFVSATGTITTLRATVLAWQEWQRRGRPVHL